MDPAETLVKTPRRPTSVPVAQTDTQIAILQSDHVLAVVEPRGLVIVQFADLVGVEDLEYKRTPAMYPSQHCVRSWYPPKMNRELAGKVNAFTVPVPKSSRTVLIYFSRFPEGAAVVRERDVYPLPSRCLDLSRKIVTPEFVPDFPGCIHRKMGRLIRYTSKIVIDARECPLYSDVIHRIAPKPQR